MVNLPTEKCFGAIKSKLVQFRYGNLSDTKAILYGERKRFKGSSREEETLQGTNTAIACFVRQLPDNWVKFPRNPTLHHYACGSLLTENNGKKQNITAVDYCTRSLF